MIHTLPVILPYLRVAYGHESFDGKVKGQLLIGRRFVHYRIKDKSTRVHERSLGVHWQEVDGSPTRVWSMSKPTYFILSILTLRFTKILRRRERWWHFVISLYLLRYI